MLCLELRGQPYTKKDHNRRLREFLDSRSPGSVEFKHQNISAVLDAMGFPTLKATNHVKTYRGCYTR